MHCRLDISDGRVSQSTAGLDIKTSQPAKCGCISAVAGNTVTSHFGGLNFIYRNKSSTLMLVWDKWIFKGASEREFLLS
jgi:hypothetical protein